MSKWKEDELEEVVEEFDPYDELGNAVKALEEMERPINGVVNAEALYLRSGPDNEAAPLAVIYKGDKITIIDNDPFDDFYYVETALGTGYCMKEFIDIIN